MEIIQRLPEDVQRYIIPFTYNPQPKNLLRDIENYQYTLNNVLGSYRAAWGDERELQDSIEELVRSIFTE